MIGFRDERPAPGVDPAPAVRGDRWFDETGRPIPDPYVVLGAPSGSSPETLRACYLERVREHPPERDPDGFRRIRAAYDVLAEPTRIVARRFGRIPPLPDPAGPDGTRASAGDRPSRALEAELLLYALVHLLADTAP